MKDAGTAICPLEAFSLSENGVYKKQKFLTSCHVRIYTAYHSSAEVSGGVTVNEGLFIVTHQIHIYT